MADTSNLYEILARKVYLSSNPSHRRTHKSSSAAATESIGEEPAADEFSKWDEQRKKSIRRRSSNRKSQSYYERPSFMSVRWQKDDDQYDLLDSSKSYRRYRLLSAANSEQARAESRAYFETIVFQVDRIKLALVCFVCFHLAFSMLIDLLTVFAFHSANEVTLYLGAHSHIDKNRLLKSITFALFCPSFTAGILIASRWHPQRHFFSLSHKNSLFIISIAFMLLSVDELATLGCHFFQLLSLLPITVSTKSAIVGFVYIYLLYNLFDVKIKAVSRQEAQKCLRAYLVMTTLGFVSALAFYLYFFESGLFSVQYLSSVMHSILLCRLIVSVNCAVVFYLIWNGVGRLSEHTTITNEDFDDFLAYYDMNRECTDQLLTLNCVSLACQAKTNHHLEELNEDNFSIRTVKVWRKSCFAVAGSIIFSFAFSAEMCHICFTSLWSKRYYPKGMTANQIFGAHLALLGSLLATRLFLLFKSNIIGHKTSVDENRELLGYYSWHRNCHKFILSYLANIVANLFQLYLVEHSLAAVYVTNLLFGTSLGFMMELVCKFISNYMTITSSTIQSALLAAMCHLSLVMFLIYYLLAFAQLTSPLFYINLFGALLSLAITTIVSWCQCLVSKNGFDLVEMQPYHSSQSSSLHQSHQLNRASHADLHALRPNRVSSPNLLSHSGSSPQANLLPRPQSSTHLTVPQMHPGPSCSSGQSSSSQLYWYQVAVSDSNVHRKSSAAAVIAYRIKYRLESIVSILK